jgi:hypothetical protein
VTTGRFALVRVRKGKRWAHLRMSDDLESLLEWVNWEYAKNDCAVRAYGLLGLFDSSRSATRRLPLHVIVDAHLNLAHAQADALVDYARSYRSWFTAI